MKKITTLLLLGLMLFSISGCESYTKLLKSTDYEYKYEAAKCLFVEGKYTNAITLLEELIMILKGTDRAEESLYMLGMCYYNQGDYLSASKYFTTYYNTYPKGKYCEEARFYSGKALYKDTPEPKLDQTSSYSAINELQIFMEYYPQSNYKPEALDMLYALQDKLVEKEYYSSELYFNMGNYMGNNYRACIITAQNALKDYPSTKLRERLSILILKAKYYMAERSVEEKKIDRYRDTVDEYYAFKNEFPESKYLKEAEGYYRKSLKVVNE